MEKGIEAKVTPLGKLIDYIQAHRFGQTGITGLNELQNNAKMLTMVVAPLLSVWVALQMAMAWEYIPREQGGIWVILLFIGWGFYCGSLWAYIGKDASKYKCFPQATVYFPDGGDRKFTFPIKPGGITKRCEWKDGSIGVEVQLLHRYSYKSVDREEPYVFDTLGMRIPGEIGETFRFNSPGEWWHKGMIVDTSNCEPISYYVYGWHNEFGKWKPVGIVADCSLNYQRALKKHLDPSELIDMKEADDYFLLYNQALMREDELTQYTRTLEQAHSVLLEKQGKGVKKELNRLLESILSRYHNITDVKESRWNRIFKLSNFVYFIIGIIAIWAFLKYGLGLI